MIPRCESQGRAVVSPTRTSSPVSARSRRWSASSATPGRASSRSSGAQKNGVPGLRARSPRRLRSHDPPSPRPPRGGLRIFLAIEVRRVACRVCGAVKRERLDFLADNPRYTKRFAFYVGKRCRSSTIKDIADELALEWHTVKELE